jgi:hypothetical protein
MSYAPETKFVASENLIYNLKESVNSKGQHTYTRGRIDMCNDVVMRFSKDRYSQLTEEELTKFMQHMAAKANEYFFPKLGEVKYCPYCGRDVLNERCLYCGVEFEVTKTFDVEDSADDDRKY